jgi:hypothetical protein
MLISFYEITQKFLEACDYTMLECSTEEEAKKASIHMKKGSREFPVYTFESDTTGEKLFEEFYTEEEKPNLQLFKSLGVINAKHQVKLADMESFFEKMERLMTKSDLQKMEIVNLLQKYIPTFAHKETGKLLDNKM